MKNTKMSSILLSFIPMLFGFTSVERELENYISKIDVSINNENNIVNELIDKHDFIMR